jgi:hypothetical protein
MATTAIFASSFFIASVFVIAKAVELRNKRKNFFFRLINRLDPVLEKLISFLKFKSLQLIQSIRYIVLVEVKELAKALFLKAKERILDEYKKRHDMMMGHKDITSNGSVSFYLKKITEHKGNGEKGKIEDIL